MLEYLTTAEAADELGREESHVRRLCRTGKLECLKRGHDWFVKRTAVQAYKANPPKRGPRPSRE